MRHRHYLGVKQTRNLIKDLFWLPNPDNIIGDKSKVEVAVILSDVKIYFIKSKPVFLKTKEKGIFPSLLSNELLDLLPSMIVDMGAVPYICNGADVMAPGIVEIRGKFKKENFVVIRDEKFDKALAISKTLFNLKETSLRKKGRVAKNIHCRPSWAIRC